MESPAAPIFYEDIKVYAKYEDINFCIKSIIIGLSIALFSLFVVKYTGLNVITNNYLGFKFLL